MKYHFEFKEVPFVYRLLLNGKTVREYRKARNSKQQAEDMANDIVRMYIRANGPQNVRYEGLMITN